MNPRPVTISARRSEIFHIRITCRCGSQFVTEVPKVVAAGENLCVCPGISCGRMFTARKVGDAWEIKPMDIRAVDSGFTQA